MTHEKTPALPNTVFVADSRGTITQTHKIMITSHDGSHRSRFVYVETTRQRWHEVKSAGIRIEERKLAFHVTMILASTLLTVVGTLTLFSLWHIGMVLPAFPSILQEAWDWLFKQ